MIRDELPIHEKFSVKIPELVSPEGQSKILDKYREVLRISGKHNWSYAELPEDWDWDWLVERGAFAGTLPKRISKLLYVRESINISPKDLAEIGNLAKYHSGGFTYLVDFDEWLDWNSGDFGDDGSCFWSCNANARELMKDNGFLAMRLFINGCGFGRCWMRPDFPKEDAITIFNCYPKTFNLVTMARLLATHLGYSYNKINLYNKDEWDGLLYINGAKGFIVAPQVSLLDCGTTYDFDISIADYENERHYCTTCGDQILEEEEWLDRNGDVFCRTCYDEHYGQCNYCGEVLITDIHSVNRTSPYGGYYEMRLCSSCVEARATCCAVCGAYWINGDLNESHVCQSCLREPVHEIPW